MSRGVRSVRRALGVLVIATAGVLLAAPAHAHDVLTGTAPAAGAQVDRLPGEVVLTFDEPAIAVGTQILVTGPNGPVQEGTPRLVDNTVHQPLTGGPAGRYAVSWRVTSADGHPVSGSFDFTTTTSTTATTTGSTAGAQTAAPATAPVTAAHPGGGVPIAGVVAVVLVVAVALMLAVAWMRSRRAGR